MFTRVMMFFQTGISFYKDPFRASLVAYREIPLNRQDKD